MPTWARSSSGRASRSAAPPAGVAGRRRADRGLLALGLTSCDGFAQAAERDAAAQIARLATAFGAAPPGATALADRSARPRGGWPDPLCGPAAHARQWPLTRALVLITAEARERRSYAFARDLGQAASGERLGRVVSVGRGRTVRPVRPWSAVRVRVPAGLPALTVNGFASATIRFAGAKYVWWVRTARSRRRCSTTISSATRSAGCGRSGIAAADVMAEHDPATGRAFVEVRTRDGAPRDDISAALAGSRSADVNAVRFLRYRDTCAPDAADLRRALSDARARARRLAADLHLVVDTAQPLAIVLETPATGPCVLRAQRSTLRRPRRSQHRRHRARAARSRGRSRRDVPAARQPDRRPKRRCRDGGHNARRHAAARARGAADRP